MPTYEYECEACGHTFERFQSMTARPVRICPECKGKVRRLLGTGAGVIFKGSGFYETDYKRSAASRKGNGEKAAQPATQSDSKSASSSSSTKSTESTKSSSSSSSDS